MPDDRRPQKLHSDSPFDDLDARYGVIYERAKYYAGRAANPLKLPNWPNPVDAIVDFQVLACDDTWQGWIKFAVASFAREAWATFVPSPAEIERKFFLGGYKCGFYFAGPFKSPMRFFIGEGGTEMLAEFTRPFTTALFWWWVAETVYAAFQTTQTVLHKEDECILNNASCMLENGVCFLQPATTLQAPAFFNVISDPNHLYPGAGNQITTLGKPTLAACAGHLVDLNNQVISCSLELYDVFGVIATSDVNLSDSTDTHSGVVFARFTRPTPQTVGVRVRYVMLPGPVGTVEFRVDRFTANVELDS